MNIIKYEPDEPTIAKIDPSDFVTVCKDMLSGSNTNEHSAFLHDVFLKSTFQAFYYYLNCDSGKDVYEMLTSQDGADRYNTYLPSMNAFISACVSPHGIDTSDPEMARVVEIPGYISFLIPWRLDPMDKPSAKSQETKRNLVSAWNRLMGVE